MPLITSDPKINRFTLAIEAIANDRAKKLLKQAEERRVGLLAAAADRIKREAEYAFQERASTLAKEVAAERSSNVTALRSLLFRERQEIADLVFAEAEARLAAFVAGPEYEGFLFDLVTQLASQYTGAGAKISVRPADQPLISQIQAVFATASVAVSDDIVLGGLLLWLPEQKMLIDERLETRLGEQRSWFYEHSGLSAAW